MIHQNSKGDKGPSQIWRATLLYRQVGGLEVWWEVAEERELLGGATVPTTGKNLISEPPRHPTIYGSK